MPAKKPASKKYADGTTYKDSEDGTKSEKLKARRKAWGCKGKKSYK